MVLRSFEWPLPIARGEPGIDALIALTLALSPARWHGRLHAASMYGVEARIESLVSPVDFIELMMKL